MDRVDRSFQGRAAGIYTSSYAAGSAGSFLIAGAVDAVFGWRATFIAGGIGPLLSICALGLLPASSNARTFGRQPPPFHALLRNRALTAYVAAFAGNTWEVFAVRVWFVAYSHGCFTCLATTSRSLRSGWSPVSHRSPGFPRAWSWPRLRCGEDGALW